MANGHATIISKCDYSWKYHVSHEGRGKDGAQEWEAESASGAPGEGISERAMSELGLNGQEAAVCSPEMSEFGGRDRGGQDHRARWPIWWSPATCSSSSELK